MEYTEILYLIKNTSEKDDIGNILNSKTVERKIYAKKNKVGSKEFYNAVAVGITLTAELQINRLNYDNESKAKYNDKIYSIIRTLPANDPLDIILVLGVKQGTK